MKSLAKLLRRAKIRAWKRQGLSYYQIGVRLHAEKVAGAGSDQSAAGH